MSAAQRGGAGAALLPRWSAARALIPDALSGRRSSSSSSPHSRGLLSSRRSDGSRNSTDESDEDSEDDEALLQDIEKRWLAQDHEHEHEHDTGARAAAAAATTSGGLTASYRRRRRRAAFRAWLALLGCVLALTLLVLAARTHSVWYHGTRHTYHGHERLPITLDTLREGRFAVRRQSIKWVAQAGDGVYATGAHDGGIALHDLGANSTSVLVPGSALSTIPEPSSASGQAKWDDFSVSDDMTLVLLQTQTRQVYRHSSKAVYVIYDVRARSTAPLIDSRAAAATVVGGEAGDTSVSTAVFAPKGHALAYVRDNDLYIVGSPGGADHARRVTSDGSKTVFNGVPDWIYEEEVLADDKALWWAPDGSKLAFLRFDETEVPEFEYPIYNPSLSADHPGALPYPLKSVLRYPKPGYTNPTVSVHVVVDISRETLARGQELKTLTLEFDKPFQGDNVVISELAWLAEDMLLVKATDRTASVLRVAIFKLNAAASSSERVVKGKVVRDEDWTKRDGGWVEPLQTVISLNDGGYLEVSPNSFGFNHIAHFAAADASEPRFLTNGSWEVDGQILALDRESQRAYFRAAKPSTDRHLFAIDLLQSTAVAAFPELTPLTDTNKSGFHSASFSPKAGYYLHNSDGPEVPSQTMVRVKDRQETLVTDNTALLNSTKVYLQPELVYSTWTTPDGLADLNVLEMRPPDMDTSGRRSYPVLVHVYGGPNAQLVSSAFKRDWHAALVTELDYIVVLVDARGTGFKGRDFRNVVRGHLGEQESQDVTDFAKSFADRSYVDEKRVGVWGWSYGGYLTAKIVERNSSIFSLAMSVAPVTDWRFYDSIYTERYMLTPGENTQGYEQSAVTRMDGFANLHYLLAHGSGDDNVHFVNSAALLDRLTTSHVHSYDFHLFTDSAHSMQVRGAYWELIGFLKEFLVRHWGEKQAKSRKAAAEHG